MSFWKRRLLYQIALNYPFKKRTRSWMEESYWSSLDKSGQVWTSLDKYGKAMTTHGSANLFFLIRNFYSSNYYQQSSVYWLKSFARPPWHTFLLNENVLLRELVVLLLHTVPNPNFCVHFFGLKMTNGQGKTFHMVPMH